MMNNLPIELTNKIKSELSNLGLDLVEIVENNTVLSIIISSRFKNIGLDDCSKVHKVIFPIIPDDMGLEISSPGIGRKLKTEYEFEIFKGKLIEVCFEDDCGSVQKTIAYLYSRDADYLNISKTYQANDIEQISLDKIKKVILSPNISKEQKVEILIEEDI